MSKGRVPDESTLSPDCCSCFVVTDRLVSNHCQVIACFGNYAWIPGCSNPLIGSATLNANKWERGGAAGPGRNKNSSQPSSGTIKWI
nr:hypothetical protein Q903MT_gene875 [Picea sitchensis]